MRFALVLPLLLSVPALGDYMDHFVVRDDIGPHKVPSQGPAELMVIPVEVAGHPAVDRAALEAFFGDPAANPKGFVGYYRTASLGRYQPHVTVAQTVRFDQCPLDPVRFPDCKVRRGDVAVFSAGIDLLREIVRRADAAGEDFAQLDVSGRKGTPDAFADGVMVLLNIPFGGIAFPFGFFNRGDNLAGGMGGPLVVDGVKIPHLAIAGDLDTYVMVHEFGHLLGLTDLYDESRQYQGLQFSVMGAWGYDPRIPLPDAETRFRLGWGSWHQASGTQRLLLRPAEESGELVKVGQGNEYFLLENRGPGTFDQAFTVRGLAVYQVDRGVKLNGEEGRFQERSLDCVNCDPWHPYIRNVQGDGRFDLEQNKRLRYEDDLFREAHSLRPDESGIPRGPSHLVASSNSYSGAPTGIVLRDVFIRSDNAIEVTVEAPEVDPCAEPLCASGEGCQALNCEAPGLVRGCGCQSATAASAYLAALALGAWAARRRRPAR